MTNTDEARTVLRTGSGAFGRVFQVEHVLTASSQRWEVTYPAGNERKGQPFNTEGEAVEYFERYTTPIVEARA